MNIIGIDTSFISDTSIGCLFQPSDFVEIKIGSPFSQEEKLLFSLNSALEILKKKISDIDIMAVGTGPGSFTGIRIGISTVKALAFSLGKMLIGVSSLELLALSIDKAVLTGECLIVPLIDARMKKVFSAFFNSKGRITEDLDIEPAELRKRIADRTEKRAVLLGDGLEKYKDEFTKINGKEIIQLHGKSISGLAICRRALEIYEENPGSTFDQESVLPVYLRKSEAENRLTD